MKKSLLKKIAVALVVSASIINLVPQTAYSHGYINGSRVELANRGINVNAGAAQYEPQSVEGPGNFPIEGPADGEIAGGGIFAELNEQTEDRWVKVPMNGGANTFTWTLTAPHKTDQWKYYITKKGWDPNSPIKRSDLELITVIDDEGKMPEKTVTHTIDIPTDREGYYVILGVWEIADTTNAFYQVIDIELTNDEITEEEKDTEAPTVPSNLKVTEENINSVGIQWGKSTDNVGVSYYNVYRNGEKISMTAATSFVDTELTAETEYEYKVTAVDLAGNESDFSNVVKAKTQSRPEVDTEAPTKPLSVHSMGETSSSIDLMWAPSTDNVGVAYYEVYRNGVLVKEVTTSRYKDTGLKAETEYEYVIVAVDEAGNKSEASEAFIAKTIKEETTEGTTTWNPEEVYLQGDKVIYNGVEYTAKWWTRGDNPTSSSAWEAEEGTVLSWNDSKEYAGGSKVIYNGSTYEAKWWTKGENPETSTVWSKVN